MQQVSRLRLLLVSPLVPRLLSRQVSLLELPPVFIPQEQRPLTLLEFPLELAVLQRGSHQVLLHFLLEFLQESLQELIQLQLFHQPVWPLLLVHLEFLQTLDSPLPHHSLLQIHSFLLQGLPLLLWIIQEKFIPKVSHLAYFALILLHFHHLHHPKELRPKFLEASQYLGKSLQSLLHLSCILLQHHSLVQVSQCRLL